MELIGAILVFLVGLSAGALVFLCLCVSRFVEAAEARHAHAFESEENRHRERLAHEDATTAIVVDRIRLVAGGLAAELRDAAAAQRNDLRLAIQLPPVHVPGAPAPPPSETRKAVPDGSNATGRQALSRSPANDAAVPSTLRDSEATPPSGWSLEQIRAHSASHEEA
jgi:hypothetical protein